MKNHTKKRGFTLVELLVVIAILAILATVSIVGYTSFTRKANLSNDQTTIGMINNNLQAASVGETITYPGDALTLLYGVGFNSGKLQAYTSDCHYVYNQKTSMFYLVDGNEIVFPESNVTIAEDSDDLWGLYTGSKTDKIEGITHYIALTPVVNSSLFQTDGDAVFSDKEYTFDLNKLYIDIADPAQNIKIQNGYAVSSQDSKISAVDGETLSTLAKIGDSASSGDSGDTANTCNIFTADNIDNANRQFNSDKTEVTFKNAVVDLSDTAKKGGNDNVVYTIIAQETTEQSSEQGIVKGFKKITFENCLFTQAVGITNDMQNTTLYVEFINCTFSNITDAKWSLTLDTQHASGSESMNFTVKGCQFINCRRGITINSILAMKGTIEDCTFKFVTSEKDTKNYAIQIASAEGNYQQTDIGLEIKNNNFAQCKAAVTLNATLVYTGQGTKNSDTEKWNISKYAIEYYEQFATFFGNNYSGLTLSDKVVADEEISEGYGKVSDTTKKSKVETAMANALKELNQRAN